ncbi:hypothetical protein JOD57_002497 [Geodermatophilus bullaregiensis]|uniref:hypothetical protein n=1 Tax=Geodermatophilus bullaregiensis TaxID=1564160 RepID=UPI00195E40A5|nr:hypothetical protein [Geodermatophilus bullaregiensis]MBM7806660.1 hypothetical protein [Geodermatophilus bullaregiensis]
MRVLTVPARELTPYGSTGASLVRAALVEQPQDGFAVDVVRLAPGGTLGRHPTRLWQLFLAVEGSGWVAGSDGAGVGSARGRRRCGSRGRSTPPARTTGCSPWCCSAGPR